MSDHRAAPSGPSISSIIVMAAGTLTAIALTLWITWGATDERHALGAALGFLLSVSLTAQTMSRAVERSAARERRAARKRVLFAEAERRAAERAVSERWPEPIRQTNPAPEYPENLSPEDDRYPQDWPEPMDVSPPPPSSAALEELRMPVDRWRSERDRQAWLDDQDTHIFTRPPEWRS